MKDLTLLPSRKNAIKRLILEEGLDHNRFSFQNINHDSWTITGQLAGKYICTSLQHAEGYFFNFNCEGKKYDPKYKPGFEETSEDLEDLPWDRTLMVFREWLKILKRELNVPDIWAEFDEQFLLPQKEVPLDEDVFPTSEQIDSIEKALEEIELKLDKLSEVSNEARDYNKQQNEYIRRASRRLNLRDLKQILLAYAINQSISLTSDPWLRQRILGIIHDAYSFIIGVKMLIPPFH